jgi:hypothetical protein
MGNAAGCRMAQVTAPILDLPLLQIAALGVGRRFRGTAEV